MSKKKPKPTFAIRLKGTGIYPEEVPARLLGEVISAIQVLAHGEEATDTAIRLTEIKRGSAVYGVVTDHSQDVLNNLEIAGRVTRDPEDDSLQFFMLRAFKRLSKISKALDCKIEIILPDADARWDFSADDYKRIRGHAIVSDDVVAHGKLIRVGGATERKCSIRPINGTRIVYCKVDNVELSRTLGKHLYQDVSLSGRGVMFAKTWEIVSLNVYSASFPQASGSFGTFLRELREIGGDGWDVADVSAELENLR